MTEYLKTNLKVILQRRIIRPDWQSRAEHCNYIHRPGQQTWNNRFATPTLIHFSFIRKHETESLILKNYKDV